MSAKTPATLGSRGVALSLHIIGLTTIGISLFNIVTNMKKSKNTKFWLFAMFGLLCLLITALVEITFIGAFLDDFRLFRWTAVQTVVGDIFVRIGIVATSTVRLWRLMIIIQRQHRKFALIAAVAAAVIMIVNLGITCDLRAYEISIIDVRRTTAIRAQLTEMRDKEALASFICFFAVQIINFGSDITFMRIILNSLKLSSGTVVKLSRQQVIYPYIPIAVVDLAFFTMMILSRTLDEQTELWGVITFMRITLMRFAPTLEFFVFLIFTVPTARRVLKAQQVAGKQSAASGSISTEATTSNGRTVTNGTTSTSFANRSSPGGQSVGSMNDIDLGGKEKSFFEQFTEFFKGASVVPSSQSQNNESQMHMMQNGKSTASTK